MIIHLTITNVQFRRRKMGAFEAEMLTTSALTRAQAIKKTPHLTSLS